MKSAKAKALEFLLGMGTMVYEAAGSVEKIGRDAFLYLNPKKNPRETFAQCAPCRMYVPAEYNEDGRDRCIIHGSRVEVGLGYSCGFMCGWPTGKPNKKVIQDHAEELAKDIPGSVTPKESGLVDRPVRCENCDYHDEAKGECGLYRMLQQKFPEVFDFGGYQVEDDACCNANTAKPKR